MANDAKLPDGSVQRSSRAKLPDGSVQRSLNKDKNYLLFYASIIIYFLIEVGSNLLDTSTDVYQLYYYPLIVNVQLIILLINIMHYICNRLFLKIIIGVLVGLYLFQIFSIIASIGLISYEIGTNAIALGTLISLGFIIWMEMNL